MKATKKKSVVHFFNENSIEANICHTVPKNDEDWHRSDWCTDKIEKVTCKGCLKILDTQKKGK